MFLVEDILTKWVISARSTEEMQGQGQWQEGALGNWIQGLLKVKSRNLRTSLWSLGGSPHSELQLRGAQTTEKQILDGIEEILIGQTKERISRGLEHMKGTYSVEVLVLFPLYIQWSS